LFGVVKDLRSLDSVRHMSRAPFSELRNMTIRRPFASNTKDGWQHSQIVPLGEVAAS
jgi:hypothetical protein